MKLVSSTRTKRRTKTSAVVAGCVMLVASLGTPNAYAHKDSGVQSWGCGMKFGKLTINLRGSANTAAPGDWNPDLPGNHHHLQWQESVKYFRVVHDHQNEGPGGGRWRVGANDTYSYATPSCSSIG